ncbi:hypothetical protein J6590_083454 [Homalodisca vitripennis]|nr:hypothetical protein J6590_083454 [Homalodisca vitripennis]
MGKGTVLTFPNYDDIQNIKGSISPETLYQVLSHREIDGQIDRCTECPSTF